MRPQNTVMVRVQRQTHTSFAFMVRKAIALPIKARKRLIALLALGVYAGAF
jgi:formate-dependent phosphoribosylglycinamide formyltransferase (GAR transformylase)